MSKYNCAKMRAEASNSRFEKVVRHFLCRWLREHDSEALLKFDQPLAGYLTGDALRDFFLTHQHPLRELLKNKAILRHLARPANRVWFEPETGDPLLSLAEQRIYNLARRLDSETVHVPFRAVQPNKQTAQGDMICIHSYPPDSETLRYNSGNHFCSRPSNSNVFDEISKHCLAKANADLIVFYQRGYMEERLQDVIALVLAAKETGRKTPLFFVICSRHSLKEGHYGVVLLVMSPINPMFPQRLIICDTLLKDLPQHPRWWYHFVEELTGAFGAAAADLIEDLSHPLQKVNIKGDDPYRHDWDCPYYAAAMAQALSSLAGSRPGLILNGSIDAIRRAMQKKMPDYYLPDGQLKERTQIRDANRLKRWKSGIALIRAIASEAEPRIKQKSWGGMNFD